ncbi:ADP-ribosylation factor-like protein 2-binding protein isoform X1 [Polypterus senegalus]|uniref:ADP-ribosylation factor-like protein 2-binding protein isoform X1 n=2 Tax=Polypterus senegalus TaxID=55291 RepID=UPI0019660DEF|nr:ADP-ribosylation factor-like protein 2-binding protein isoform X1 [Polypterus senegalus]
MMASRETILFSGDHNTVEGGEDMEQEEFLALSFSGSDAAFDSVIGYIEDVIIDDNFQQLQRNFMEKYYMEFEESEENKLCYTPIFKEYIDLLETYIEQQLMARMPGFSMSAFIESLEQHKEEIAGDIFDMLVTFTDFLAFKEMFLDYRAEKEGRGLDLSSGLVVRALTASPPTSFPSNGSRPFE